LRFFRAGEKETQREDNGTADRHQSGLLCGRRALRPCGLHVPFRQCGSVGERRTIAFGQSNCRAKSVVRGALPPRNGTKDSLPTTCLNRFADRNQKSFRVVVVRILSSIKKTVLHVALRDGAGRAGGRSSGSNQRQRAGRRSACPRRRGHHPPIPYGHQVENSGLGCLHFDDSACKVASLVADFPGAPHGNGVCAQGANPLFLGRFSRVFRLFAAHCNSRLSQRPRSFFAPAFFAPAFIAPAFFAPVSPLKR
jgi:hypothetical protein